MRITACTRCARSKTSRSPARRYRFIRTWCVALACIKQAAALTNNELGLLDDAQDQRDRQSMRGDPRTARLLDEFVVDVIQGGAGTSTNMNANEVDRQPRARAARARARANTSICIRSKHVNMSQSTNDVYPTALKVALHFGIVRTGRRRWRSCAARSKRRPRRFATC